MFICVYGAKNNPDGVLLATGRTRAEMEANALTASVVQFAGTPGITEDPETDEPMQLTDFTELVRMLFDRDMVLLVVWMPN